MDRNRSLTCVPHRYYHPGGRRPAPLARADRDARAPPNPQRRGSTARARRTSTSARSRSSRDAIKDLRKDTRQLQVANEEAAEAEADRRLGQGLLHPVAGRHQQDQRRRLCALRRPLLHQRRRSRHVAVPLPPRPPRPEGQDLQVLRVQVHARLRRRAGGDPGRLPERQLRSLGARSRPASTRRPSASSACSRPTRSCSSSARCPTTWSPTATSASCSGASRSTARWSTSSRIFNGVVDGGSNNNDIDFNDDKIFAGRLFFLAVQGQPVGVGARLRLRLRRHLRTPQAARSRNPRHAESTRPTASRTSSPTSANSPATATGTRLRRRQPVAHLAAGLLVLGPVRPAVGVGADRTTTSAQRQHRAAVRANSWQTQFSWVITGEDNTYRGTDACRTELRSLEFLDGNWGAFEVAARYAQLARRRRRIRVVPGLGFADPNHVRAQSQLVGHRPQLVPQQDGPPDARLRPHHLHRRRQERRRPAIGGSADEPRAVRLLTYVTSGVRL